MSLVARLSSAGEAAGNWADASQAAANAIARPVRPSDLARGPNEAILRGIGGPAKVMTNPGFAILGP
jgi:hypothetical protein